MDTSTAKKISLGFGIFYLLIGVLGFIPGITTADTTTEMADDGLLLGIFGVNLMHNLSHLLFGAILIYAGTAGPVRMINRIMAVVFAVLFVATFIPQLADLLHANTADALLHLASAALTGYLGFAPYRDNNTVMDRA